MLDFLSGLPALAALLIFAEGASLRCGFPGAPVVASMVTVTISSSAACVPCFAPSTVGAVESGEGLEFPTGAEEPVMPMTEKSAV